jgi:hypothetical protein
LARLTKLLVKKAKKVKDLATPKPTSTAEAPAETVAAAPAAVAVVEAQATQIVGEGVVLLMLMMHLENNPDEEPGEAGDVWPDPGEPEGVLETRPMSTSALHMALTREVIGMSTITTIGTFLKESTLGQRWATVPFYLGSEVITKL